MLELTDAKKFGFGCMRLPMKDGEVDYDEFKRMIDYFMESGFCYFDTAHGYLDGKSETAIRDCLASRYPRESYMLTDKLSSPYFEKEEEIRPLLEKQLKRAGVEYFDYYLMHAMKEAYYVKYQECRVFEILQELKAEGKIRHVGMSFHDKAEVLDKILTEHPEIEIVQLQFNYLDYDDPKVESYKCYQVCEKHHKPVIVMEPVKGGALVQLPDAAKKVLDNMDEGSYASYAIRFCASFPQVEMILSGMSDMAQMEDNISFMKDRKPFTASEHEAVKRVREIIREQDTISCTACRYCTEGCPMHIDIPELFACYNANKLGKENGKDYGALTKDGGKASACIKCGKCENVCPQQLKIRNYLEEVAKVFE